MDPIVERLNVKGFNFKRMNLKGLRLPLASLGLAFAIAGCAPMSPPGSRPAPLPDLPIEIVGRCNQTEEDGFHEQARLDVRSNLVQALSWRIDVGRKGQCRFELGDFRQVKARPSIELIERAGGSCKLMVWQGQGRVTLAHAGCERFCTAGIYEQAWPVMFNAATGACAAAR